MFKIDNGVLLVIRRIDQPNKILKYGNVYSGGLGEYDENIYEEVYMDELPADYEIEKEKQLAMGTALREALEGLFEGYEFEMRLLLVGIFLPIMTVLDTTTCNPLSKGDFETIQKITENSKELDKGIKELLLDAGKTWAENAIFVK